MNVGSVEMNFKIQGLENQLKNLGELYNKINQVGNGYGMFVDETLEVIKSFKEMNKMTAAVLKNQTELAGANDAVVRSAKKISAQLTEDRIKVQQLVAAEEQLLKVKQRIRSMGADNATSGFKQFSQRTTPLGGQSSAYRTDLANPIMRSWQGLNPINKSLAEFNSKLQQAGKWTRAFITPSERIQSVLGNWWQHFGRIGIGFGTVYAGLRAIGAAAHYAFSVFTGGLKVMDDIRSSGAMVAGMLALVTSNGKAFAENYTEYFANFQTTLSRAMVLLPQYGLTMEQFMTGARELAQFGVVIDNDNLEQSIASMKIVQEIASNLKGDTKQIRQELQSFFTGQTRLSEQFGLMIKNSMPELKSALEKIRKEGGTTQQMWEKLNKEMFKMAPSLKAANANLETQHTVLKASLSVISAMALEATGLYDMWLKGLTDFNGKLFDTSGNLTEFGIQIYKVFYKAWEWTKDWSKVLLGVGQIIYGGIIHPLGAIWTFLVNLKDGIIDWASVTVESIENIWDAVKSGDAKGAMTAFSNMRAYQKESAKNSMDKIIGDIEADVKTELGLLAKGLENFSFGMSDAFTNTYKDPTIEQIAKMRKALTGLLAPAKEDKDKLDSAWSDALSHIKFDKINNIDYKFDAEVLTPYYDTIKAYNEKMAEDFKLTFLKIRTEAESFGNYLGNSFSGLFDSVFKHEVTSFEQFFIGALKSIQDAFSSMLSDMVSEYFKAMMRMQFQKGAADFILGMAGSSIGGTSNVGGIDSSKFSLGTLTSLPNNRVTTGNYSLLDNNFYSGGVIPEPVFGIGQKSGASYSFAEKGPERVLSNRDSKEYGSSGSTPNVTIQFNNESGVPLTATQSGMSFDGEKYVTSIIVKQMSTNPSFRSSMRG